MKPSVLSIENVSVVRDGATLLSDVSLEVRAGERWALLGPNGAGKSTLLSLCGAFEHPTKGRVSVLGHELGRVDMRALRTRIGHVNPAQPLPYPMTAREVVLTGVTGTIGWVPRWRPSEEEETRALELLVRLGLGEKRGQSWPTLSQGERGRTLIARALATRPDLLLLDEPTTGLDLGAREMLLSTLDRLASEEPALATVLVTHHLEELPRTTTHVAILKAGRLVGEGPVDECLTSKAISDAFDVTVGVERRAGRWMARSRG